MASNAHPKTLFHLVPTNQVAHDALLHPDNKRFVSSSKDGPGLEVGYHVPSLPRGHVITRLGRDADLILRASTTRHPMSAVHVAFEVNPATHLILLSVRSKRISSVTFAILPKEDQQTEENVVRETIIGDGVILYAQDYHISIASYEFDLIWRAISNRDNADSLKGLTVQGYKISLELLQDVRSRDRPTETGCSEAQSWHITRLNTTKGALFRDIRHLRNKIGSGAYGKVYSAVDQTSGYEFAIKVVELDRPNDVNIETARALLHREIKVMERVKHEHIIEYLGHQLFDTLRPEIFMPLRAGSVTSLAKLPSLPLSHDELCSNVMEQMLSALDYLANENLIHRDLKPDNILYSPLGKDRYLFQLADFGLAHHRSLATTICGTGYFQAPELWPGISKVDAGQSPKLDVWPLFASIIAVRSRFEEFPPKTSQYGVVLSALGAHARALPKLEPMARLHPDRRASAAQMLVILFEGKGLTTPRSRIPPIEPPSPPAAAGPNSRPRTSNGPGTAPQRPTAATPLIVYPPSRRPPRATNTFRAPPVLNGGPNLGQPAIPQLQSIRAHRDGVVKRRPESRASGPNSLVKILSDQKLSVLTGTPLPPVQDPPALEGPPEPPYRIPGAFVD